MFPLIDQSFTRIVTAQGPMNKVVASALYARGYVTALQLFLQEHCSEAYVDKSQNKQQGGNGGGYGNNGGNGGGNNYGNNSGGGYDGGNNQPAESSNTGGDGFW
jgi:uncharacterized membrane protein